MKTSTHTTKITPSAAAIAIAKNDAGKTDSRAPASSATRTMPAAPDPFFDEPIDPIQEAVARGFEVIRHLLIWQSSAPTLEKRGLRATVAIHCLFPGLIGGMTLEQIGDEAGCTRQSVHTLARDFRNNMGLDQ